MKFRISPTILLGILCCLLTITVFGEDVPADFGEEDSAVFDEEVPAVFEDEPEMQTPHSETSGKMSNKADAIIFPDQYVEARVFLSRQPRGPNSVKWLILIPAAMIVTCFVILKSYRAASIKIMK